MWWLRLKYVSWPNKPVGSSAFFGEQPAAGCLKVCKRKQAGRGARVCAERDRDRASATLNSELEGNACSAVNAPWAPLRHAATMRRAACFHDAGPRASVSAPSTATVAFNLAGGEFACMLLADCQWPALACRAEWEAPRVGVSRTAADAGGGNLA